MAKTVDTLQDKLKICMCVYMCALKYCITDSTSVSSVIAHVFLWCKDSIACMIMNMFCISHKKTWCC